MTNADYYSELAVLRRKLSTMTLEQRSNLLRVYKTAADQAAEVLKSTLAKGYSTLTSDRWRQIELQLRDGAQLIGDATDSAVKSSLTTALNNFADIDKEYITSAVERAGMTITGLTSIYTGINNKVISAVTTSVYNGVSYSERVWGGTGVSGDWLSKVKSLVTAGTAQGLDPVKIAKSLQEYVRGGVGTIGRWGKLVPGASDYVRRMGSAGVDYRALRIVRSELYRGIQSAQVEAGEINPACTGLYDWISHNGCPVCDALMQAGPYKKDDIPDYAHPNCSCVLVEHLYTRDEFMSMLKDYDTGADTDGARHISEWAGKYGLSVE